MTATAPLLQRSASGDRPRGWHPIPHTALGVANGYNVTSLRLGLHTRHHLVGFMLAASTSRPVGGLHFSQPNPRVLLTVKDNGSDELERTNEIFHQIVHYLDDMVNCTGGWLVFPFSPSVVCTHTVEVTAALLDGDRLAPAAGPAEDLQDIKFLSDVVELTSASVRLCAEQVRTTPTSCFLSISLSHSSHLSLPFYVDASLLQMVQPETVVQVIARLSDPGTFQGRLCRLTPPLAVTLLACEAIVWRFGVHPPRAVYALLLALLSMPLGLMVGFCGPLVGAQLSRRRGSEAAAFGFIPMLTSPSAAAASLCSALVSVLVYWGRPHGLWSALAVCLGVNAVIFVALCYMIAVM